MSESSPSDALGRLYSETGHLVLRRCLQILRNREEALDAVQWTFSRAIEVGFDVRSRGEALAWLYRTASRRCLWVMRNASNRLRLVERHRPELESLPMPSAEGHVLGRDLMVRALDGVTDEQAEMILMTFVWGYGQERVAELMGTSVRTVGRARARFQEQLDRLTIHDEGQAQVNGRM